MALYVAGRDDPADLLEKRGQVGGEGEEFDWAAQEIGLLDAGVGAAVGLDLAALPVHHPAEIRGRAADDRHPEARLPLAQLLEDVEGAVEPLQLGDVPDHRQVEARVGRLRAAQALAVDRVGDDVEALAVPAEPVDRLVEDVLGDEDHRVDGVQVDAVRMVGLQLHPVQAHDQALVRALVLAVPGGVAEAPLAEDDVGPLEGGAAGGFVGARCGCA